LSKQFDPCSEDPEEVTIRGVGENLGANFFMPVSNSMCELQIDAVSTSNCTVSSKTLDVTEKSR